MLAARERQVRRHQRAEGAEGVRESSGNERVRTDDALRKAIEYRRYRCGVLRRVELAFLLDRFLDAFVIVHPESFDPGHWVVSPFEGLRLISSRQHVALERRGLPKYKSGFSLVFMKGPSPRLRQPPR